MSTHPPVHPPTPHPPRQRTRTRPRADDQARGLAVPTGLCLLIFTSLPLPRNATRKGPSPGGSSPRVERHQACLWAWAWAWAWVDFTPTTCHTALSCPAWLRGLCAFTACPPGGGMAFLCAFIIHQQNGTGNWDISACDTWRERQRHLEGWDRSGTEQSGGNETRTTPPSLFPSFLLPTGPAAPAGGGAWGGCLGAGYLPT